MTEFDLMPPGYARGKRMHRHAKYLLAAAVTAAIVVGASWLALHTLVVVKAREVAHLQARSRLAAADRARLQQDRERVLAMQRQLAALEALRGADSLRLFIDAIDAAYVPGIWFEQMRLTRHIILPAPAAKRGRTAAPPAEAVLPPDVEHTAEIDGHAVDYSALGEFVRRLGRQPGVFAVRLIGTGMRAGVDAGPLEAKIALNVGDRPGGAP